MKTNHTTSIRRILHYGPDVTHLPHQLRRGRDHKLEEGNTIAFQSNNAAHQKHLERECDMKSHDEDVSF
jgi:hypothetical protein